MSSDLVSSRVTVHPQVRSGQPIIRGTRITVWEILGWLGGGLNESNILTDYPELPTIGTGPVDPAMIFRRQDIYGDENR